MGHHCRFLPVGLLVAVLGCGPAACAGTAGGPVFLAADAPPAANAPANRPANPPVNPNDFSPATLTIAGGTIDVRFTGRPGTIGMNRAAILQWIETAAVATSRYCGRFPVKNVRVEVRGGPGRVGNGWTYGGRLIRIRVGTASKQADLDDDWVMTHEMFHLAFPDLADNHDWMEEGLSTYLEPLARARIGTLTPEKVWGDMVEGLPRGLPPAGDRGLDRTRDHGRIYWGGCLYWFLADVEIRKKTDGRKSLDDAIRAILDAGGDGSADWEIDRVISVGDRATGTAVLREMYDRMGGKPDRPDLDALWRDLGVVYRRGRVTLDDKAPLATVRAAMTARPPEPATRPAAGR